MEDTGKAPEGEEKDSVCGEKMREEMKGWLNGGGRRDVLTGRYAISRGKVIC